MAADVINITENFTLDQAVMLTAMMERRKKFEEGRETEIVQYFPSVTSIHKSIYLGSFAWSTLDNRYRWVMNKHSISLGGVVMTPSDVARDYLSVKYHGYKGVKTKIQWKAFLTDKRSHPLYAKTGSHGHCIYLDITSAYWQIVSAVGWDADYSPQRFLGIGERMKDFPFPKFKLARNCLVTVGNHSPVNIWNGEKISAVYPKRSLKNISLYPLIMDVLHAFAREMIIRASAVYVHTDGYIIPEKKEAEAYRIANEWGIVIGERYRGDTIVRGAGNYDIGERKTKLKSIKQVEFDNIRQDDSGWMKRRISRIMNLYSHFH